MILLFIFACGTVTNGPFDDDANFLAALPDEARQTVGFGDDTTDAAARGLGDRADLVELSVVIAAQVNGFVLGTLGLVDRVRELPPTERGDNTRRWGPYEGDCGVSASLLMSREFGVYQWSVLGHPTEGDDGTVLYGTHFSGETVVGGDGSFVWDHGRWASWCGLDESGLVTVDYDNRDGVDLLVLVEHLSLDGAEPTDWTYAYTRTDTLGDFQYRTVSDLAEDGSDELATVTVRDRWIPGTGGRSDAQVTGGGFGDTLWQWSQCWGATGRLTFQTDSLALTETVGNEADCVFEAAEVDRL